MMWQDFFTSSAVRDLGWTLLHSLWQETTVAVLLALLLGQIRAQRAQVRYMAGCAALVVMAIVPVATYFSIHKSEPGTSANVPLAPAVTISFASVTTPGGVEAMPLTLEAVLPWCVMAWFLGLLFVVGRLATNVYLADRLRRSGVEQVPSEMQQMVQRLARKFEMPAAVRVLASMRVESPVVVGFFKPVVLVPLSALTAMPAAQWEAILAHELAHIKRYDPVINLLQTLLETVLFFHPAVWWVSAEVRREREHCCDDMAVAVTGDRLLYARALASLEQLRVEPAFVLGATDGSLKLRLKRLLFPNDTMRPRVMPVVMGALCVLVFGSVVLGLHPVQEMQAVAQEAPASKTPPRIRVNGRIYEKVAASESKAGDAQRERIVRPDGVYELVPPPAPPAPPVPPAPAAPEAVAAVPDAPLAPLAPPAPLPAPAALAPAAPLAPPAPLRAQVAPLPPVPPMPPVPPAPLAGNRDRMVWRTDSHMLVQEGGKATLMLLDGGDVWYTRDPQLIEQFKSVYRNLDGIGRQMGDLGRKQGELGEQQARVGESHAGVGRRQEELARQQEALARRTEERVRQLGNRSDLRERGRQIARMQRDLERAGEKDRERIERELREASKAFERDAERMNDEMERANREMEAEMRALADKHRDLEREMRSKDSPMQQLDARMRELDKEMRALDARIQSESKKADQEGKQLLQTWKSQGKLQKMAQ